MYPVQLVRNEEVVEYPVVQSKLSQTYTDLTIDFIKRNKDRPFFVYLPHAMPHKPLAVSDNFYTPDTPKDLYADVIAELDHCVGQVLDAVKKEGLEQKTLVIFTSDILQGEVTGRIDHIMAHCAIRWGQQNDHTIRRCRRSTEYSAIDE
jgi:uncharacterized sulfatase